MGNSKLASRCHIPSGETPSASLSPNDNGILARIRGDLVSQALRTLPAPSVTSPATAAVIMEVEGIGTVQFSVARKLAKRGKHSHYYWSAERAERIDVTTTGET